MRRASGGVEVRAAADRILAGALLLLLVAVGAVAASVGEAVTDPPRGWVRFEEVPR